LLIPEFSKAANRVAPDHVLVGIALHGILQELPRALRLNPADHVSSFRHHEHIAVFVVCGGSNLGGLLILRERSQRAYRSLPDAAVGVTGALRQGVTGSV